MSRFLKHESGVIDSEIMNGDAFEKAEIFGEWQLEHRLVGGVFDES